MIVWNIYLMKKNKLNEVYANNASVTEELFLMFNNFIYDDYDGISENKIYRLFLESLKEMISYSFDCAVSKSYLRSYFKILNNKNVVGLLASVMKTKTTDIENIMKRLVNLFVYWQNSEVTKEKKLTEIIGLIDGWM